MSVRKKEKKEQLCKLELAPFTSQSTIWMSQFLLSPFSRNTYVRGEDKLEFCEVIICTCASPTMYLE